MKITWAHTLAAQKMVFFMAFPVPPFFIMTKILQAITLSWWISPSTSPICELPHCAIRPLPNILLHFVCASDPQCVVPFHSSFGPFSQNVQIYWLWGHRCQICTFVCASLLGIIPTFDRIAPIEALVSNSLPAVFASFYAPTPCGGVFHYSSLGGHLISQFGVFKPVAGRERFRTGITEMAFSCYWQI